MVQLRTLVRTLAVEHVSPEVVLRRAGAAVARATDRELHATCGFAVLDVGTRTLRWASAGHLPLLRVGAEAAFLEAPTGLPLGVDPDGEVQAREVVLDPGDRVVAFTDGLRPGARSWARRWSGSEPSSIGGGRWASRRRWPRSWRPATTTPMTSRCSGSSSAALRRPDAGLGPPTSRRARRAPRWRRWSGPRSDPARGGRRRRWPHPGHRRRR